MAAPPPAETAATLTGYVLVPAEPTAGTATALKAALKAAADYSPNGVPVTMQRSGMVTQAIRAYIRAASADAETAAKLSDLLEDMAGEMARARDVLGQFVSTSSDPGTEALSCLWCMERLPRKARTAGMLQRDSAGRSTAGHLGQDVADALNAVVQFVDGKEYLGDSHLVSVDLSTAELLASTDDVQSLLTLGHLQALALTMKGG